MGNLFSADNWFLAIFDSESNEVSFRPFVEGGQARPMESVAPEGVIHHILSTRRPVLLTGDIGAQLRELGLPSRGSRARLDAGDPSNAMAFLGEPLLAGDEPLGVIAVADRSSAEAFGEDKTRLLAAFAAQLASAMLRVRALEQTRQAVRQVAELNARYEQTSRAMQAAQRELNEQSARLSEVQSRSEQTAGETDRLHGQATQLATTLQQWRELLSRMVANAEAQPAPAALEALAGQELLLGTRALGAQASLLYLSTSEGGELSALASHGLALPLLAALHRDSGLAQAAVNSRRPVLVGDLPGDPRWVTHAAESSAPGSEATMFGSGAAGQYQSALALPLLAGEQVLGAVVFLSTSPDAFNNASLPVGAAAASQIVFAVQAAAQGQAWQQQMQAVRYLIAGEAAAVAAVAPRPSITAVTPPVRPAVRPAVQTNVAAPPPPPPAAVAPATPPVRPPTLTPTAETTIVAPRAQAAPAADMTTQVRHRAGPGPDLQLAPEMLEPADDADSAPVQRSLDWRLLALLAAILAIIACLAIAVAANAGLLKAAGGLFGAASIAATSTRAATSTPAGTLVTFTPPTEVIVPPTQTLAAQPSATATAAAPTETPGSTNTPGPTATLPLPADVVAVATVDLGEGVIGRLRDSPNGAVIGGITGGTPVHVLSGRQTTPDGIVWVEIRVVKTGQVGWFAENLLKYEATPTP
jgi:GAF domain-containing protein